MSRDLLDEIEKLDEQLQDKDKIELTKDIIYGIKKMIKRLDELALFDLSHMSDNEREKVIERLDVFLEKYKSFNKQIHTEGISVNKSVLKALEQSLEQAKALLTKHDEVKQVLENIHKQQSKSNDQLATLQDFMIQFKNSIPKITKTEIVNPIDKVEILNELRIKKPEWFTDHNFTKEVTEPLAEVIAALADEILKVKIVNSSDPTRPLAVRLSDGKRFYTAGGGGVLASAGGSGMAFQNSSSVAKRALVDGDGHVQVDVLTLPAGGLGGTQYTEGDTDATITGNAFMWEDTGDTLRAVSAAKPLPVNVVSGSAASTEYTEGDADTTFAGIIAMAEGPSNVATPLQVDASKHLQVDIAADSVGLATSAKQASIITELQNIDAGKLEETTFTGRIGEVQASPTANTVLDRLKTIGTHAATIAGAVAGSEVQVDVITMPTTTVQATNLDIRDIDKASDDILVYANTAKDGSGTSYVPLVDSDGHLQVDVLSGGGAGTQYTEDAAAAADPVGNALIMVRKDTLAGITSTDGDNVAARGTDKGELYVKHVDTIGATQSGTWNITNVSGTISLPTGASTLAEQQSQTTHLATIAGDTTDIETAVELIDDAIVADDAAFTPATTKVMMAGFEFDDSSPDTVNEGDAGAARMSSRREIYMQIRDAAGNERGVNVNASNELLVALSSVPSHAVTNAGTFAVQVDGSALTALQLIDDTVFADDAAFTIGTSKVNAVGFVVDESSTDSADEGDIGAARMTTDRKQIVAPYAHAAGGYTPGKLISGASTNGTNIKNAAGTIGYITASNINASPRYLKIYNKSSSPTVGSDTPVHTFLIPGNTAGAGTNIPLPPQGINLDAGISIALTTGVADSDTGAVAANEIVVNYGYK